MVFYRKYRPQTLDEVVGQTSVKATLQKAFQENRLSHAYLFCGPRGTGKTSTARILAKMVNCESKDKAPCNSCHACQSITDGSNLDLIEIDAASNRGIDDIRSLRENIKLAPTSAHKKVYIIDEVHMLSTEAFNALLKTLEEPPEHVLFILATTEAHKIPITILSRVQKLDFQLGSTTDVINALKRVVEGENLNIDDEALRAIAKASEGSFRDGTKILDQLASKNTKISLELVEQTLNAGSFSEILSMIEILATHDPKQALAKVAKLTDTGINLKEYTLSLIESLRYLFLIEHGAEETVKDNLGPARFEKLSKLSQKFSPTQVTTTLKLLQQALEKMKTTNLPILSLEIALVEACQVKISDVGLQISAKEPDSVVMVIPQTGHPNTSTERHPETSGPTDGGEGSISGQPEAATSHPEPPNRHPELVSGSRFRIEVRNDKEDPGRGELARMTEPPLPPITDLVPATDFLPTLQDKWAYILETVKSMNFSLEAMLRSVKLAGCSNNVVSIEVPYSFHQRILESPKNRDLLESILSDVLNNPIRIAVAVGQRPVSVADVVNIELAADDEIIRVAAEIFSSDSTIPPSEPAA